MIEVIRFSVLGVEQPLLAMLALLVYLSWWLRDALRHAELAGGAPSDRRGPLPRRARRRLWVLHAREELVE